MNTDKYTYQYFLSNLGDGKFDPVDKQLRTWLNEGYKPLREVNIGNTGLILFVLSKKVDN